MGSQKNNPMSYATCEICTKQRHANDVELKHIDGTPTWVCTICDKTTSTPPRQGIPNEKMHHKERD